MENGKKWLNEEGRNAGRGDWGFVIWGRRVGDLGLFLDEGLLAGCQGHGGFSVGFGGWDGAVVWHVDF